MPREFRLWLFPSGCSLTHHLFKNTLQFDNDKTPRRRSTAGFSQLGVNGVIADHVRARAGSWSR